MLRVGFAICGLGTLMALKARELHPAALMHSKYNAPACLERNELISLLVRPIRV